MGTFVETMLGKAAGAVVTVEPDYIIINDGVSHAAVDEISTVAEPQKVLVIYDHDVPTGRPEAAAVLRKNLEFATAYGCRYIQAKGVGYQYLVHEVVKPGQIIIGGGSHGGIFGAKGALGINVSIPELARVTETGRYSIVVPETEYISLKGWLTEGVTIMDAALACLKAKADLSRKAVEFYCPTLDQHQKEVLCSMACMTGAYTAGVTEACPEEALELDLGAVEPMAVLPCESRAVQRQAKIVRKSELSGMEIQAGQIGGYTGGTIEELRRAAAVIEGKHLVRGFRLTVCPATSRDYIQAAEEGILAKFIDFGAQISAAGDHSVVVQGPGVMGPKERLVTTGLYTFAGAMGCADAEVYTVSMESVIAASFSGRLEGGRQNG
ncbi:aconitase family protein [Hungatella sp.]|uniref:aconitase family protein n=1 Tax=Hungatella sp. TaxID=2613924 RepID=UPI002A82660E|nr:aconitase family protein [Hungatella sp.]